MKKGEKEKLVNTRTLASLINDLNDMTFTELPLVDESGYMGEVSVDAAGISDLDSLKRAFSNEGFQLEETERELLMMVVRDK